MNKFKQGLNKTAKFLRKNIYYVLIITAVAAIGAMVAVTVTQTKKAADIPTIQTPIENPDQKPDDNSDETPGGTTPAPAVIVFIDPVTGGATGANFSDTEPVFSKTLNQWSTHEAIDYFATEGTAVMAVYKGVVTNIENDSMLGYCVTLSHGDGLVTKYCGLNENIAIKIGDSVVQGEKLGEVGSTMLLECNDGPHLHFETYLNDTLTNPAAYFVSAEK